MAIDTDRLTLERVSYTLKRDYEPLVRDYAFNHRPLTRFIQDREFELNAGEYMVFPMRNANDNSIVVGNIQSIMWPDAGRTQGVSLMIAPSDMTEMMGSLKLDLKARSTLRKGGRATVGDQLAQQLEGLRQNQEFMAALSTIGPSTGRLGALASNCGAGHFDALRLLVTSPGANFFRNGQKICGSTTGAAAIDWVTEVAHTDRLNNYLYWEATPTTVAGTDVASTVIASSDGIYLYDSENNRLCTGYNSVPEWMVEDFALYNITAGLRTGGNEWKFFNPTIASAAAAAAVTLTTIENALINHFNQKGITPDAGFVSPDVFRTIAHLSDAMKRLEFRPTEEPDFVQGFAAVWVVAGQGRVPILADPMMYNDRAYFLRRSDWSRVMLEPWHFEPQEQGIWKLDNDYGFHKARAWCSFNYVCIDPAGQLKLANITA